MATRQTPLRYVARTSQQIKAAIDRERKGAFSLKGLQGFDLQGKTNAIVGTGGIGREAIRIAKGFGMNGLAFDVQQIPRTGKPAMIEKRLHRSQDAGVAIRVGTDSVDEIRAGRMQPLTGDRHGRVAQQRLAFVSQ